MSFFRRFSRIFEGQRALAGIALYTTAGHLSTINSPKASATTTGKTDLEEIARWRTNTDSGKKLVSQGRLDEAQLSFSVALEASIRGFGLDAPHVAMSCNNLAEVFRVQGKLDQAIELYKQAVEVFLIHYALEDPRTATTYYNLASALYVAERYSEAKEAAEKAYEGMKGAMGSERKETMSIQVLLAKSEWKLAHRRKAISQLTVCQQILFKKDMKSMDNAQLAGELLFLFIEMDQDKNVRSMLDFVVGCFAEAGKANSFLIRQLTERIVDLLVEKKKFLEAMELAVAAEASLKRLDNSETLSLATLQRKQALILSEDPKGSMTKAAEVAVASFEMVWNMMNKIPEHSGLMQQLPEFLTRWFRGKEAEEECQAHNLLILNCIYDLVQNTLVIVDLLKNEKSLNSKQQGLLMDCLKRCLDALEWKNVQSALAEASNLKQYEERCKEISSAKNEFNKVFNSQ